MKGLSSSLVITTGPFGVTLELCIYFDNISQQKMLNIGKVASNEPQLMIMMAASYSGKFLSLYKWFMLAKSKIGLTLRLISIGFYSASVVHMCSGLLCIQWLACTCVLNDIAMATATAVL